MGHAHVGEPALRAAQTNPKADQYDIGNLYGPYVSLRYYWKKQ